MIKQLIPKDYCLKCKGCCRFKEEISVWAPCLLEEEIQDLLDRKIPPASISLKRRIHPVQVPGQEGFLCPFLNTEDNHCKIYAFRPFECQLYPFLLNLRDKKIILTVDLNCPYVQEAAKTPAFKDYTAYLAEFLNSPPQMKLLKSNPQLLQAYEEVAEIIELNS
ncbi:MAG: YkgJ family cysteine cluster protein [Candidatus Omnitrophota bacterium]